MNYVHEFRPSPYTAILLMEIEKACLSRRFNCAVDIGVGSGLFLAVLGKSGVGELWGTDISPTALESSASLLAEVAPDSLVELKLGDLWDPIPKEKRFDMIVANLPSFPAYVVPEGRPSTWAGGDGRATVSRFLRELPNRLTSDGVVLITHNDLTGMAETERILSEVGMCCDTIFRWTVFEPPERINSVSEQVLADNGQTLRRYGGYAFVDSRILKIRFKAE